MSSTTAKRSPTDPRTLFLESKRSSLRLGGYRGTVHVEVVGGQVRVRSTQPTRRQKVIGPDSRDMRELAVAVAEQILAAFRAKRGAATTSAVRFTYGPTLLTPRQVWAAYLKSLLGGLPEGILEWGQRDLRQHYLALGQHGRRAVPSYDSIWAILVAARRLDRDGAVPLDGDLDAIQPGDLTRYLRAQVTRGASPHTMRSYFARLRSAVRFFQKQFPDVWAGRRDPTQGVSPPSTRGVEPPEIGEERAIALIRQLRRDGEWRAAAAAIIALASGRRIGAICGRREGKQLDHPPLTALDFSRTENGLEVIWRAAAAKGEAFGQGDEVQICTRRMAACYRWLRRCHPNPAGPEHPLIWDEANPTKAAAYDGLRRAFDRAWRRAFGEDKPAGLSWHSFCRTTITTISDELGVIAAAEHTGRSPETAQRIYKRKRRATQARTVRVLDQLRRSQRRALVLASERRPVQEAPEAASNPSPQSRRMWSGDDQQRCDPCY